MLRCIIFITDKKEMDIVYLLIRAFGDNIECRTLPPNLYT